MNDIGKFFIYMLVALIVFVLVLLFTLRKRSKQPVFRIVLLSVIAVVGGMTFARITYGKEYLGGFFMEFLHLSPLFCHQFYYA